MEYGEFLMVRTGAASAGSFLQWAYGLLAVACFKNCGVKTSWNLHTTHCFISEWDCWFSFQVSGSESVTKRSASLTGMLYTCIHTFVLNNQIIRHGCLNWIVINMGAYGSKKPTVCAAVLDSVVSYFHMSAPSPHPALPW